MRFPFPVKQSVFLEAALIFIERNRFVLEEMEFQGGEFLSVGADLPGNAAAAITA